MQFSIFTTEITCDFQQCKKHMALAVNKKKHIYCRFKSTIYQTKFLGPLVYQALEWLNRHFVLVSMLVLIFILMQLVFPLNPPI
ncbi:hypothetical protein GDO78_016468 [Eleutherodactylus coqui]|uniref:Uncharacterized protein n=1 Tax=Eleutherodactylus coqui TaxID=57060 RepID=A0A8J6JVY6_ELECQ|nr:hypothetical protein GDO78_016468 [Eleutherodactylus coqui]